MERAEYEAMHLVEGRMWWYRGLRGLICDLLAARPAGRSPLVDVGCGTGGMLQTLRTRFPAWRQFGLEYDREAARMAAEKSGVPVVTASIDSIPLANGSVSAFVCLDVLSHATVDPQHALKELHRCLESGGILALNVPAYRWMLSAHDRRVHNSRRFSRREVRAMLRASGLRPLRISYWNTFLFPLMAMHRLLASSDAGSDVHSYPALVNSGFLGLLTVERWLMAMGLNLPFGGSIVAVAVRD